MNYKDILNQYLYESDLQIKEKAQEIDSTDYDRNRDLINEIVLWKLNRSVKIQDKTIMEIHGLREKIHHPLEAVESKDVELVIIELLESKGIKIAMASTILHFYYPDFFPIIDQRAYRELTGEELPEYHGKDKNQKYMELYLDYIEKCYKFNTEILPEAEFEYIDKILYQLDKDRKNKVKY